MGNLGPNLIDVNHKVCGMKIIQRLYNVTRGGLWLGIVWQQFEAQSSFVFELCHIF